MRKRTNQSGNAVMLILIAVVLFGALAYTFMRGSQQGQGNMTAQQAKIAAQEILNYSRVLENGVNKVRSRGCSERQLSFDYDIPATTGYENANAPVDYSCHIFDPNGAGLSYLTPPSAITTQWFFRTLRVLELGANQTLCTEAAGQPCNDLVAILSDVPIQICEAINLLLHNSKTIPLQDNGSNYQTTGTTKFIGSYSSGTPDIELHPFSDKSKGCLLGTDGKNYFFYALLVR